MNQLDIDIFYLREAYKFARDNSRDKTQNAAILVTDNSFASLENIVAWGANHFPPGVKENKERMKWPLKYEYIEHAERAAIYDAAKRGIKTAGLIMYCPWCACADCGRAIILAGIKEVIGHMPMRKFYRENYGEKWEKSIELALQMFEETGTKYRFIEEKVGDIEIMIANKKFEP